MSNTRVLVEGLLNTPLAKASPINAASISRMSDIKLESELGSKFQELDLAKVLCEHVCWIFSTLNIEQRDFLLFNTLSDKVIMNINVFRSFLLYRI